MTTTATAPPVAGQTEESRAELRGVLSQMNEFAEKASTAISAGGEVRKLDAGGIHKNISDMTDDERTVVLAKVSAFLNTSLQGPMFVGEAGGRLFVGEYPRRQQLLDVQSLVSNKPGEELSIGQQNTFVIGELRSSLKGWIPAKSPQAQLLRAHIETPAEWKRLGIELHVIDWLESRDPYVYEREIEPLWKQWSEWKEEVTPTRDEIDFYSGLTQ